jgi:hypothetical protein
MVFWVATADICHRGAMALLITANPWLTERGEGRVSSGRREWLQGFVMQPTNHNNNTTTVLTTVAAPRQLVAPIHPRLVWRAPTTCPEAVGQHCVSNARQSIQGHPGRALSWRVGTP